MFYLEIFFLYKNYVHPQLQIRGNIQCLKTGLMVSLRDTLSKRIFGMVFITLCCVPCRQADFLGSYLILIMSSHQTVQT